MHGLYNIFKNKKSWKYNLGGKHMHGLYSALSALNNLKEPSVSNLSTSDDTLNIWNARKVVEYDSYSLIRGKG